ncbi:MAG: DUF2959 domain-containing protein [Gammaproteobacteria bacterium]|nr:DUF2959 domain-containing protein [Gammaproteobacteria bacterium]NVK87009.1 DUF2959 domain-containing protein [Gammaproteobacteria bacterium]
MPISHKIAQLLGILTLIVTLCGCQKAYFGALEKVGIHKRDVLVSRVEKANETQQEAKQQFKSALEKFQSVVSVEPNDIDEIYQELNDEYEQSQALADDIAERIADIESVSTALFSEWEDELSQYTSPQLRQQSAAQLTRTKQQYRRLITAMKRAENSMTPVLNVFKDQVLFLKHNLNAKAINSLRRELVLIQANVAKLTEQMNQSIAQAERFIASMNES